jgi:hypothetical protein
MTDAKATDKEEHPLQLVEKQALKSPDAHVVQNANGQQFQAALKANLNHHSGSAGSSDAESIQINLGDGRMASGLSAVTENQLNEPESIKNARSISLHELVEKQENEKDLLARSLVGEYEQLLAMRKGPARDVAEKNLQNQADRAYCRGQYASYELPASQAVEPGIMLYSLDFLNNEIICRTFNRIYVSISTPKTQKNSSARQNQHSFWA